MFNLIIGGGIVGLLAAYYNKDYRLISKNIGGQMNEGNLGPRILEVNENSENLLKEFGIKENIKKATIGYEVDGLLVNTISQSDRFKYYMKSRRMNDPRQVPSSVMSDGKNEIIYYDLNWNILIKHIEEKIKDRIIYQNVREINTEYKVVTLDGDFVRLPYNKLISTIPAPLFYKLCNIKNDSFKYVNKYFMITSDNIFDIKDYDYVYFVSDKYDFHRITRLKDNRYCVEYTTNDVVNFTSLGKLDEYYFMKYGQLVSGYVDKFDNIEFLGRFAEWNHDIKVDDIIGKLTK